MSRIGEHTHTIPDELPLTVAPLFVPPIKTPEKEPVPLTPRRTEEPERKAA